MRPARSSWGHSLAVQSVVARNAFCVDNAAPPSGGVCGRTGVALRGEGAARIVDVRASRRSLGQPD